MQDALKGPIAVERTTEAEDRDADLVTRARRDRRTFAALYDRYLEAIYRFCYVRLDNREAAEDALTQSPASNTGYVDTDSKVEF